MVGDRESPALGVERQIGGGEIQRQPSDHATLVPIPDGNPSLRRPESQVASIMVERHAIVTHHFREQLSACQMPDSRHTARHRRGPPFERDQERPSGLKPADQEVAALLWPIAGSRKSSWPSSSRRTTNSPEGSQNA